MTKIRKRNPFYDWALYAFYLLILVVMMPQFENWRQPALFLQKTSFRAPQTRKQPMLARRCRAQRSNSTPSAHCCLPQSLA